MSEPRQVFLQNLSCRMSLRFGNIILFNLFLRQTDTHTEWEPGRGREREGDTESEAGSRLPAVSTEQDAGLEPTSCELVSGAEVGRFTDRATRAPREISFGGRASHPAGVFRSLPFGISCNVFGCT